jgi:hypothetical protein
MYTEEKFREEMIEIFNTHNLKVDCNKDGRYFFEKIPNEKIQLVENDIRNVMKKYNWICQVVKSGDCITVSDLNWLNV